MICPKCAVKMRTYDTRNISEEEEGVVPVSASEQFTNRIYVCMGCALRYSSTEYLDREPLERQGVPKAWLRKEAEYEEILRDHKASVDKSLANYIAGLKKKE